MGIGTESRFNRQESGYQFVKDNVNLFDDKTVRELNYVIVEFGRGAFKKRGGKITIKSR